MIWRDSIKKSLALLFAIALVVAPLWAIVYLMGDADFAYPTSVSKPSQGGSWTDPITNVTGITRISNRASTNCNGNPTQHVGAEYSTWNPQSSDGNWLLFECGEGGYGVWSATAPYTFQADVSISSPNGNNPEYRWDGSGSFPTRIYYRSGLTLRYFNFQTENPSTQSHTVKDFTAYLTAKGVTMSTASGALFMLNGDEGTASDDSSVWAWTLRYPNSGDGGAGVLVYDKTADAMNFKSSSGWISNLPDNVKVSITGNYLMVSCAPGGSPFNQQEGNAPWVYNISAHGTQDSGSMFSNGGPWNGNTPHDAWSYTKQGHEAIVGLQPNGPHNDTMSFYTPHDQRLYEMYDYANFDPTFFGIGINQMTGPSAKKGWAFMSSYTGNTATEQAMWAQASVWAMELDETKCLYYYTAFSQQSNLHGGTQGIACGSAGRIWRVAYEQNFIATEYYYTQPNASINAAGTKIWFGSNFRSAAIDSDAYEITLPSTWLEDLNGASTQSSIQGKALVSGKALVK